MPDEQTPDPSLKTSATTQAFAILLVLFTLTVILSVLGGRTGDDPTPDPGQSQSTGTRIDVNSADTASLSLLPGIGPGIAKHIITARAEGVVFRDADDLEAVPYIGPKLIARVEPWLIYNPPPGIIDQ